MTTKDAQTIANAIAALATRKMKYRTNRCNLSDGADIESKDFATKANAIKWGRRCVHFWIRRIETRELVACS